MPVTQTEASLPPAPQHAPTALPEQSVVAYAVLEQGRYSWLWIVNVCPYCGKQHDHCGGPLDGDPYQYIGMSFAARCDLSDRQRLVVDDPSVVLWYQLASAQPDPQPIVDEPLGSTGRG